MFGANITCLIKASCANDHLNTMLGTVSQMLQCAFGAREVDQIIGICQTFGQI
jgi:hypothetical protein